MRLCLRKNFLYSLIFLSLVNPIYSEYTIQLLGGRNAGDFLFETGNRFPNLSGLRAGSRITFERDYNIFGVGGKYFTGRVELLGKFTTTGWYVPTGKARDEDFYLYLNSSERGHNINTREFSFYDSTSVYGGQRNFADGIGKSSMSEYNFDFLMRYYFGKANPDIHKSGDGFYLSGGARYTYNKYLFYDVVQWVAFNPIFYQPIGLGLSYTNSIIEFPFGFGYRWNWENVYFDTTMHGLVSFFKTKDYHYQRNINFNSNTAGLGILAQAELGYKITYQSTIFLRMNQHRSFTKGTFVAVGGITEEDILSNFIGKYNAHINVKQFSVEFGFDYRPEWGNSKSEVKIESKELEQETIEKKDESQETKIN